MAKNKSQDKINGDEVTTGVWGRCQSSFYEVRSTRFFRK